MRSHKKKTAADALPVQIFLSRQASRVVNQMPETQLSRTPSVMPVMEDLEPFTGFRQISVTLLINNKKYDMGLLSCKVQDEELLIADLIHQLKLQKNEGSEFIDKSLISIQDLDESKLMQMPVYIHIGQDPLHKDCRFNLQGDSIEIKIQSAYKGLLDQVLEGSTPDKTQKQRCLSEVVERVIINIKRLLYGADSIPDFMIRIELSFRCHLTRLQRKSTYRRRHWTIIYCRSDMARDSDLISIRIRVTALVNFGSSLRGRRISRSLIHDILKIMQQFDKRPLAILTHTDAKQRAALISNVRYQLSIHADLKQYLGSVEIEFDSEECETFIDFAGTTLISIQINGVLSKEEEVKEKWKDNRILVKTIKGRNIVSLAFRNGYTTTGFGLFKVDRGPDVYIYSLFCSNHAHSCFPCFDQPDIKATFNLEIFTPPHWNCISNSIIQLGEVTAEHKRTLFHETKLISTYLFCMAMGDWQCLPRNDGIQINLYCEKVYFPKLLERSELILRATRFGLQYYEQLFEIPMAFEKYDQIFCPEFQNSGMEHPGAVFLASSFIQHEVTEVRKTNMIMTILHEISHMWFGDLITMEWWNDIWLNEAFAVYISYQCMEKFVSNEEGFQDIIIKYELYKQRGLLADLHEHQHPVWVEIAEASESQSVFDNITYSKGAAVLSELVHQISFESFIKVIKQYLQFYQWKNTNMYQLFDFIELPLIDQHRWMVEWVQQPGFNIISIEQSGKNTYLIQQGKHIRQHYIEILIIKNLQQSKRQIRINSAQTDLEHIEYDCLILNDTNQSYCIVSLDEKSINYINDKNNNIYSILNLHQVIQVLNIQFQMCMIQQLPIQRYVSHILTFIEELTHPEVLYFQFQVIRFAISTLQELIDQLALPYKQLIYPSIFQSLITLAQRSDIRHIIIESVGHFAIEPEHIHLLYLWVTGKALQEIKFNMAVVKHLIDCYFYLPELIGQEELQLYQSYWNNLKPYNISLQLVHEATQATPDQFADMLQDMIKEVMDKSDSSFNEIEMQLVGLSHQKSLQYQDAYLAVLPAMLETKNRQLINAFLTSGCPRYLNLQRQLDALNKIQNQEFQSLIYEQYDKLTLKMRLQNWFEKAPESIL